MNKKAIIIGVLVGVAIIGGIYLYNKNKKAISKKNNIATNQGDGNTQTTSKNTTPKYRAKENVSVLYNYNDKGELWANNSENFAWIDKGRIVDFEKVTIKNTDYLKDGNKYYKINSFELIK